LFYLIIGKFVIKGRHLLALAILYDLSQFGVRCLLDLDRVQIRHTHGGPNLGAGSIYSMAPGTL
jgi:hypothetical protein